MSGPTTIDLFPVDATPLADAGHRARAVNIGRAGAVVREIVRRCEGGELDETLYRERLGGLDGISRPILVGARSIIVVATPQPMLSLTFERNGARHAATIPPTYFSGTDRQVRDLLSAELGPYGYRVEQAYLPVKLLAVRSGLADYGRNNITYIGEMGSFFRLTAFYTDASLTETEWTEPRMAAACERCSACRAHCPTEAIGRCGFLIRAERCLTFHNERNAPFPKWIDRAWHHCLIGCMRCQMACPMNARFSRWTEESAAFSEKETVEFLTEDHPAALAESTRKKLRHLGLLDDFQQLSRNLKAIIDR